MQHQRVEKLIPPQGEAENPRREHPWHRQRHDDAQHGLQPGCAVDERRVLELAGDGAEVPHQQPGRERNEKGRVDEDQGPVTVVEPEPGNDLRERNKEERGGTRYRRKIPMPMLLPPRKRNTAQRIADQDAAEERQGRGTKRHDQGVPDPARKVSLLQEEGVVIQRRLGDRERFPPRVEQSLIWLERDDQHPGKGKKARTRRRAPAGIQNVSSRAENVLLPTMTVSPLPGCSAAGYGKEAPGMGNIELDRCRPAEKTSLSWRKVPKTRRGIHRRSALGQDVEDQLEVGKG